MPFFDTYKNINRGGITSDSKTATRDALLAALGVPEKKDHVIQIVKTLLDFKAHQSDDASAERLLGNLANHVNVIGDPTITERRLHELVKNRSAIFKRDLPDTFKGLLRTMLNSDAKRTLIDTNTARILKSNSLITDAEVKTATPVSRVRDQVLPSELAAVFTRCKEINPAHISRTWTLASFLHQLALDYTRSPSTAAEWKSLAYVVRQVSSGRFGSSINRELQRNGQETFTKTAEYLRKKINSYTPKREPGVSMEGEYDKGGDGKSYAGFLHAVKSCLEVCKINALHEAVGEMQERQQISKEAARLSQHLPGEVNWTAPKRWQFSSNPQHQQWLELRNAIDAKAFEIRQRSRDTEDRDITYALLMCAGRNQMVQRMIIWRRDDQYRTHDLPYNANEEALASRLANCLATILGANSDPEQVARGILSRFVPSDLGQHLPSEWNKIYPQRYVTTRVDVGARILEQMAIVQLRLPGCHPVEDFYLYQNRVIQFSWDERANFISAHVVSYSDWMCSTRDIKVAECDDRLRQMA